MDFEFPDTIDNEEKIPNDYRSLYAPAESGGFALVTDNEHIGAAVSALRRLRGSLTASRAEAKAHKANAVNLAPLSEFGATPDEIHEQFTARLDEARKTSKSGADFQAKIDTMRKELGTKHGLALEVATKRSDALLGHLKSVLVTGAAKTALAQAGILDPDLGMPYIQQRVKVVEDEGDFAVQVVDEAGEMQYSTTTGSPMTIPELVGVMKGTEKFQPLFKSEAPKGGGAPPKRTPLGKTGDPSKLSSVDKIQHAINEGKY